MLKTEQLQYLGLEASHRAFALEDRCRRLESENVNLASALEQAQQVIERMKRGPDEPSAEEMSPLPPIVPPPPAHAQPDDADGVGAALDEMAAR